MKSRNINLTYFANRGTKSSEGLIINLSNSNSRPNLHNLSQRIDVATNYRCSSYGRGLCAVTDTRVEIA